MENIGNLYLPRQALLAEHSLWRNLSGPTRGLCSDIECLKRARLVAGHAVATVLLFAVALMTSAPSQVSEPYRTRGNSKMGSSTEGKKTGA